MVWFLMLIYVREVAFHSYLLFRVVANSPLFGHMPLLTLPTTLFKQKQSLVLQITTYQVPKRNCCCGTSICFMLIWLGSRLSCVIKSGSRTRLLWLLSTVGLSLLVCLAPTCDIWGLKCLACLCAKAHTRTTKSKSTTLQPEKNQVLKRGHLVPGCCVSVDHYMSSVMGWLPCTFGHERIGYSCGALFVDHASGKLFNFCQYSTTAAKTLSNKCQLESIAWQEGITIQEYHADNGIFASKAFKVDCDSLDQKYTFSGVGAHHQNGVAERNIKTVAQWARVYMLHFAHHWPSKANVRFWPQAIEYALWVFNRMPNLENGLSPNELWSSC
jgi:hypothetical protein